MKTFCLIALIMATAGTAVRAQSNTNAAPKPPSAPMHIESVSGFFDGVGRKAVYSGNVRVDDPQMKLRCELLTVDLPQSGGRLNHIVAETNVVIDFADDHGQTNHAASDKAVYDYIAQNGVTNETVTLTGNASVTNAMGWITGEPIFLDLATKSMRANNQKSEIYPKAPAANTNAPTAGTNSLTAPKTNLPAGTIDNIDRMIIPQKP